MFFSDFCFEKERENARIMFGVLENHPKNRT